MAHRDKGQELCDRVLAELNTPEVICEVEVPPAMVGRQMTMILNPKK
jgi:translation initiation factor IF-3